MKPNPTRPIVLIEDNPMDVDLTRRAFEHNHLANPLIVLRDGEEALEYISGIKTNPTPPLLILLDLKLPKVHGLEVLKTFRKNSEFMATPVVILTSSAEDSDIKKAYSFGANSYIVKPVNFDKFLEVAKNIELYWVLLNTPA
jgi:CheY-like chemotaxis protein